MINIKNIITKFITKYLFLLVLLIIANTISYFIASVSKNIFFYSHHYSIEVYFNPFIKPLVAIAYFIIIITYLIIYYFLTLFFKPNYKAQFYLFVFTIFLSFTMEFNRGVIYLVVLYALLKKFNKI